MSGLDLSRASKIPPSPWTVDHPNGDKRGYTCHMAVIHWALISVGYPQNRSNEILGAFARANCPGCKGAGPHGSLAPRAYGIMFCGPAQRIPSRDALFNMVEVGDVLITGNSIWPSHSMVLRQKRARDHITIRGFNNHGTLGTGIRDQYDPVSHNITQDKYWVNPQAGSFGHMAPIDLNVIPHNIFIGQVQALIRNPDTSLV